MPHLTADHVVGIGRGRLIADTPTDALAARFQRDVLVRAAHPDRLADLLRAHGATVIIADADPPPPDADGAGTAGLSVRDAATGGLSVRGMDAAGIGDLALRAGIALRELTPRSASLEEAFMELTEESVEYGARAAAEAVAR
ncbi:hypothetical protein [Nonomuraea cypriaca]|uniref:hypothetical protein n=1 Tax=Nonomuraea cypriaca TaxID=1187855 RepID=UPI001F30DD61|nr:hypothetical protein [Nonomuraea cypriaca]